MRAMRTTSSARPSSIRTQGHDVRHSVASIDNVRSCFRIASLVNSRKRPLSNWNVSLSQSLNWFDTSRLYTRSGFHLRNSNSLLAYGSAAHRRLCNGYPAQLLVRDTHRVARTMFGPIRTSAGSAFSTCARRRYYLQTIRHKRRLFKQLRLWD